MNIFMNLVKKILIGRKTRSRVKASKKVKALLLPTLDLLAGLWLASSFCFLVELVEGMTQKLYWVQDLGANIKNWSLIVTLLNKLADLLSMKLLKL